MNVIRGRRIVIHLLLATILPVSGFAAHWYHQHLDGVHRHHETAHAHRHCDDHRDRPGDHDHQPVESYLQLAATARIASSHPSTAVYGCDTPLLCINVVDARIDRAGPRSRQFPDDDVTRRDRRQLRHAGNLSPPLTF